MQNHIKISFVGDLSISGLFFNKVSLNKEIFDIKLLQTISDNDFFVCNFEGPAIDKVDSIPSNQKLKSPENSISYLEKRGINVFNLANNHIFDYGQEGLKKTTRAIEKLELDFFGAGEEISRAQEIRYLEKNGVTCALIGITDSTKIKAGTGNPGCFSPDSFYKIENCVNQAAQKADWVILNYHGGEEFTLYPSPHKRKFIKTLCTIDKLNIVIAHHSHTFQGIEEINKTTVFYSLGNFIFDYTSHNYYNYTNESAIVSFEFDKSSFKYILHPIYIDKQQVLVKLLNNDFIEHINKISDFSGYYRKFMLDSYRRVFNLAAYQEESATSRNRLHKKSPLKWVLNGKFYKLLFTIIRNKNTRSIYLSATLAKLLFWFGYGKSSDKTIK